jgi:hypothetical protein
MDKPFNLNRPPHLISNEVLRRIEGHMAVMGDYVSFGESWHTAIRVLIEQYQDKLVEESLKTPAHKTPDKDVLHIRIFQEVDGLWYAHLKTDEYTTYHVYSATGATRHEALQNLVAKMDDI